MMGLRAPPSDARAARAKKLRERATVIAAKGRYNKQGAIPAAILGMLYDFVEECDRARARRRPLIRLTSYHWYSDQAMV